MHRLAVKVEVATPGSDLKISKLILGMEVSVEFRSSPLLGF